MMDKPKCTEFCPDPNDMGDHDSSRKQWSKIDTCAKRYTHYCRHDHVACTGDDNEIEYDVCNGVLQYVDE